MSQPDKGDLSVYRTPKLKKLIIDVITDGYLCTNSVHKFRLVDILGGMFNGGSAFQFDIF